MSSTYRLLCLDHHPALVIDREFTSAADAAAAASRDDRAWPVVEHAECDLVLGRWSGGLVELGCPPHDYHPHHTGWVDVTWLRLLYAAGNTAAGKGSSLARALELMAHVRRCWTFDRLLRLRTHLQLEEPP